MPLKDALAAKLAEMDAGARYVPPAVIELLTALVGAMDAAHTAAPAPAPAPAPSPAPSPSPSPAPAPAPAAPSPAPSPSPAPASKG